MRIRLAGYAIKIERLALFETSSRSTATMRYTMDAPSGAQYLILGRTDNDPATSGNQTWTEKVAVTVTNAADSLTAPSFYKSKAVKARGTYYVTALYGSECTDTLRLVK